MTFLSTTVQGLKVSAFQTLTGAEEFCITGSVSPDLSFEESLEEMAASYRVALMEYGLDESTQQFTRLYISDSVNEQEQLLDSSLFSIIRTGAFSIVQQRPLDGGPLGLFSYHIRSRTGAFHQQADTYSGQFHNRSVCTKGRHYSLVWSSHFSSPHVFDSGQQTRRIFSALESSLVPNGMTIGKNTIRTWIFVRDIDNHYGGMVKARREYFETIGLTAQTRYLASTGIEGKTADPSSLVTLDAFSIGTIQEGQIERMEAPEYLSSTIVYGVTFERGLRVRFGDRSHLYLSGTASIDKSGKTIHPCDVRKQAERTFDNVSALLAPHGATLGDMQYFTIYLRNPKHYPLVQDILAERIPESVPWIAVEAPVCRPGWLFEVDGLGIIPDDNPFPPLA
ncbi:MAG: hypothetical protein JW768_08150 [Chitinispirillaceae bacterium]|nr:hypothetical protein [Chitinispirillaceae bacterium]